MSLPDASSLFHSLVARAGNEQGARTMFQTLVTDLVGVEHPDANEVAGPGGRDWGIDTYVGKLDDRVAVWQSKFFLSWTGKDQQNQVNQSIRSISTNLERESIALDAWTLCIPCLLPPEEQKWWD